MNSEIDITQFGSRSGTAPKAAGKKLVGPPRRIFSRYVLPLALLMGFAGVTVFAFRGALVTTTDVLVTMPVRASEKLVAMADFSRASANGSTVSGSSPEGGSSGHAGVGQETASVSSDSRTGESAERPPVLGRGASLFQAPGWIEPSPYPLLISSLRSGTIESLHVIEGQNVSSGTIVARLVDDDARLDVRMHESALRLKQARYDAAKDRWENPTSLVESVDTAKAKGAQLDAQARRQRDLMELAGLEARIGNTLSRSGFEPSLETTRKETELSASRNQLLETRAEIALNSATLNAASERMRLRIEDREALETAEAELMEASAALDTAKLALDRSVITAPTSGTIMRLAVAPGSMLSSDMDNGMTVAEMYKPDMLQVRVDVPLAEAAKVRPGLPAEIRVEALPDMRFRGELVNIVPQFNLQKNVLPVKVRIYDPVAALRPEMIARVEFFAEKTIDVVAEKPVASEDPGAGDEAGEGSPVDAARELASGNEDYLVLPSDAIFSDTAGQHVYIVDADSVARNRNVVAAAVDGGMSVVREGIRISDKIILKPGEVAPGQAVRIKGVVDNGTD